MWSLFILNSRFIIIRDSSFLRLLSLDQPPRPDLRSGVIRSYTIIYREYFEGRPREEWHELRLAATQEVESIVLSNLKPSAKYDVLVRAQTNAGVGPAVTAAL